MFALIRRDPLIRSAYVKWCMVAALTASVVEGVRTLMATGSNGQLPGSLASSVMVTATLWLPLALFLAFGRASERCTRMDMGLPIPARRLWTVHLFAILLCSALILAIAATVMALHYRVVARALPRLVIPDPRVLETAVALGAVLVGAAVLMQGFRPYLCEAPRGRRRATILLMLLGGGLGLALVLRFLPPAASLVPLSVAVYLGWRICRSMPESFLLAHLEADSPEESGAAGREEVPSLITDAAWSSAARSSKSGSLPSRLFLLRFINRSLAKRSFPAPAAYVFLILWGVYISGLLSVLRGWEEGLDWMYITLTGYVLFSFIAAPLERLHLVDFLPISRRFLFAYLILPGLAALMFGYGIGRFAMTWIAQPAALVQYQMEESTGRFPPSRSRNSLIRIPFEYCRLAWHGDVPASTSAWGESHPALSVPLFEGSKIAVYSPFHAPEGSSPEFVALQISRAVQAVYGKTITPQEIQRRYLAQNEGGMALKEGGLALLADHAELKAPARVSWFPVFLLSAGVLFLVLALIYMRFYRASVSDGCRKTVFFGLLALVLAIHLVPLAAAIADWIETWAVTAFLHILLRQLSHALPGGNAGIWILCALLFLGIYRLAQTQFERIEVPTGRRSE